MNWKIKVITERYQILEKQATSVAWLKILWKAVVPADSYKTWLSKFQKQFPFVGISVFIC